MLTIIERSSPEARPARARAALLAFERVLARPIGLRTRAALVLLALPVLLALTLPLWHIKLSAPQYPEGLDLWIYATKVEAGHDGRDLDEINILNHYIGMRRIDRAALTDLDWLPFAFGAFVILALRVAVIGDVRMLVDLTVLVAYVTLFAFARFIHQLYTFGHDLDPAAPMDVAPFMPPILGAKQIANFTSASWPGLASGLLGVFACGLIALVALQLVQGLRSGRRAS